MAGAALNAIVIAGHLASGIGPCASVMVPAPFSISVTVPCPLARIGVAAAGAIALLSVLPVISEESGVSAFWPQAAVRPARRKTSLKPTMYLHSTKRRIGQASDSTFRYRWFPYTKKQKQKQ